MWLMLESREYFGSQCSVCKCKLMKITKNEKRDGGKAKILVNKQQAKGKIREKGL